MKSGQITYLFDLEQGTDEWHRRRAGNVEMGSFGSSEAGTVAGTGKGREKLIKEKLVTASTGWRPSSFEGHWMKRGKKYEQEALTCLEEILDEKYQMAGLSFNGIVNVGMVINDSYVGLHDSPDGLVDSNDTPFAPVEIKTLSPAVHEKYLKKWVESDGCWLPSEHKWQLNAHRVINASFVWYFCYDKIHGRHILVKVPPPCAEVISTMHKVCARWRTDWKRYAANVDQVISDQSREIEDEKKRQELLDSLALMKIKEVLL